MNKKFLKLCLVSILSLSFNTNLMAHDFNHVNFSQFEEEEDEEIENFYQVSTFHQGAKRTWPEIDVDFSNGDTSLEISTKVKDYNKDINDFLKYLSNQSWLKSLRVLKIIGLQHDGDSIVRVLDRTTQLSSLTLEHLKLDRIYMAKLSIAFEMHHYDLHELILPNNGLREEILGLAFPLSRMRNLRMLDLNGNKIDALTLGTFSQTFYRADDLRTISKLQTPIVLNLNSNNETDADLKALGTELSLEEALQSIESERKERMRRLPDLWVRLNNNPDINNPDMRSVLILATTICPNMTLILD